MDKYTPDLKRGKRMAERCTYSFWDSLNARSDDELQDLLEWAKQMSQTNCGWQEYTLRNSFITAIDSILLYNRHNRQLLKKNRL